MDSYYPKTSSSKNRKCKPKRRQWDSVYGRPRRPKYGLVSENLTFWDNHYGLLEKPVPLFHDCYYNTYAPVTTCGYRPNDPYYEENGGYVDNQIFGFLPPEFASTVHPIGSPVQQQAIQMGNSLMNETNPNNMVHPTAREQFNSLVHSKRLS